MSPGMQRGPPSTAQSRAEARCGETASSVMQRAHRGVAVPACRAQSGVRGRRVPRPAGHLDRGVRGAGSRWRLASARAGGGPAERRVSDDLPSDLYSLAVPAAGPPGAWGERAPAGEEAGKGSHRPPGSPVRVIGGRPGGGGVRPPCRPGSPPGHARPGSSVFPAPVRPGGWLLRPSCCLAAVGFVLSAIAPSRLYAVGKRRQQFQSRVGIPDAGTSRCTLNLAACKSHKV